MSDTSISESSDALKKPKRQATRYRILERQLTDMLGSASLLLYMKHQADGTVLMEHSESLAHNLVMVAEENEKIYNLLKMLCEGSVYSALFTEIAVIILAIMKNHNVKLPALKRKKEPERDDTSGTLAA